MKNTGKIITGRETTTASANYCGPGKLKISKMKYIRLKQQVAYGVNLLAGWTDCLPRAGAILVKLTG